MTCPRCGAPPGECRTPWPSALPSSTGQTTFPARIPAFYILAVAAAAGTLTLCQLNNLHQPSNQQKDSRCSLNISRGGYQDGSPDSPRYRAGETAGGFGGFGAEERGERAGSEDWGSGWGEAGGGWGTDNSPTKQRWAEFFCQSEEFLFKPTLLLTSKYVTGSWKTF